MRVEILHGEQDKPLILTSSEVRQQVEKSWCVLVTGYFIYADPLLLHEHADGIFKRIGLDVSAADQQYVDGIVGDDDTTTVGIHIRHGDFADYKDGAYFFPFAHYRRVAESLVESHPDERIRFVICSDTEIPDDAFAGLDYRIGPNSVVGDLYALSKCDYVVGPRSTFNRWSAYWGRKPRFQVDAELGTTSFKDFKPQNDLTLPALSPQFQQVAVAAARPTTTTSRRRVVS